MQPKTESQSTGPCQASQDPLFLFLVGSELKKTTYRELLMKIEMPRIAVSN